MEKPKKHISKLDCLKDNKSMIKSGLKIGDEVIIEGYSEIIGGSLLDIKN